MMRAVPSSDVDCLAVGGQRRLHDRLGHREMRMRGPADFGGRSFERFSQHDFGNYITRVVTNNLAPDHLAVLFGRDDFHEALGRSDRDCSAKRAKRELADLDFDPARFRVRLAEAHGRDLRLAVDASGNVEQIEPGLANAGHYFHRRDSLRAGLVREQGRADDIADRIDAWHGGLEGVVYFDKTAALEFDPEFLEPDILAERCAPDGD